MPRAEVGGYVAMEHYTVRNTHFGEAAELMANVRYEKGIGKRYQVLWRRGPEFLQGRVINRILKEDATLSGPSARTRTLFHLSQLFDEGARNANAVREAVLRR
jgi:hypothetical protein